MVIVAVDSNVEDVIDGFFKIVQQATYKRDF